MKLLLHEKFRMVLAGKIIVNYLITDEKLAELGNVALHPEDVEKIFGHRARVVEGTADSVLEGQVDPWPGEIWTDAVELAEGERGFGEAIVLEVDEDEECISWVVVYRKNTGSIERMRKLDFMRWLERM